MTAVRRYSGEVVVTARRAIEGGVTESASGGWSVVGYVWHLVDVLRFGAERLRYFRLDTGCRFPGWDADVRAEVRQYELMSLEVGLASLQPAADEWINEAGNTPGDEVWITHGEFGEITATESMLRNAHELQHHTMDIARLLEVGQLVNIRRPSPGTAVKTQ